MFDRKIQGIERIKLSREIVKKVGTEKHILLELPTGTGKSFNSINILNKRGGGTKGIVFVPRTVLIENFKAEMDKFLEVDLEVEYACYQSIKKFEGRSFDFMILDEVHNCTSPARIKSLKKIKVKETISLSATLTSEQKVAIKDILPMKEFKLSLQEAIERGLLPRPTIYVLRFNLDDVKQTQIYVRGKQTVSTTDKGKYDRITETVSYWRDGYEMESDFKKKQYLKNKMLQAGGDRTIFLSEIKEKLIKQILSTTTGLGKRLVMCHSIEQAEFLGGKENTMSSNRKPKENIAVLDDFNSGSKDALFVKDMLTEGVNINDCKYLILGQLGNSLRDFVQKLGRILRHDTPVLYLLHANNTVDDRFFNYSTTDLSSDYFTIKNI